MGTSPKPEFRPDIQGLRALAVISVVLYHAGVPYLRGGYVGVDIFFVISGYLITGLLMREFHGTGRISLPAFYARRALRLLPAAAALMLATTLVLALWAAPLDRWELAPSLLWSSVYASNFWFARSAVDYLGGELKANPVLHTWSLSVEEQFYLVWPLLLWAGLRWGATARHSNRPLALMVTLIAAASFGAGIWMTEVARPWAFFASPLRTWEFAVGALAVLTEGLAARSPALLRETLAALGLAGILAAITGFDDKSVFPGALALLPVGATALLIQGGTGPGSRLSRLLGLGPFAAIGNISYSWYLWHWPLLVLPSLMAIGLSPSHRAACVLLSLVLAVASYRWLETPVRYRPRLRASPALSLSLGLSLTLIMAGSAQALRSTSAGTLAAAGNAEYAQVRSDLPPVYGDGCHAEYQQTEPPDCSYGAVQAGRTLVLVGDSHGAQWFPALEKIASEHGWRLVSLTKSACPFAEVTVANPALGREYVECASWRQKVLERIRRIQPELVLIANSSRHVKDPPQGGEGVSPADWQHGIGRILSELQASRTPAILLRDTPWPPLDVPRCLSRAWKLKTGESSCDFSSKDPAGAGVFALETAAAKGLREVGVVDMSEDICADGHCPARRNGWPTYRDAHHLSKRMSAELAPALFARLRQTGLLPP